MWDGPLRSWTKCESGRDVLVISAWSGKVFMVGLFVWRLTWEYAAPALTVWVDLALYVRSMLFMRAGTQRAGPHGEPDPMLRSKVKKVN